tara:strand:+ start:1281 stop:2057 length:777 start_codon:yes stop_codon:yes gene_type:complete
MPETITSPLPVDQITEHDRRNALAWPAEVNETHFGWLFRCNHGVTRRANSVLPLHAEGNLSLDVRLVAATHFYRKHNLPCCFTITAASVPSGLDAALEDRGFTAEGGSEVRTADLASVAGISGSDAELSLAPKDTEQWRAAYLEGEDHAKRNKYIEIMRRISVAKRFAVAIRDGQPVAAGLGVLQDGWLTILGMQTAPDHRRAGHAATILRGLADWAGGEGATKAVLQVESDNEPASRLYERAGFATAYDYHYRVASS